MSKQVRSLLLGMGLALVLGVIGFAVVLPAMNVSQRSAPPALEPLPKYTTAPDFSLTDQSGQTVTLDDLKGRVWAADFFFTSCPGICPILSGNMQSLNMQLADHPQRDEIQLVSFSLDPQRDTVEALGHYADNLGVGRDDWWFLTGATQSTIWALSEQGFKLAVDPTPEDPANPIMHSGKVVLIDRDGVIRGYYEGLTEAGMADLQRDLLRLVEED